MSDVGSQVMQFFQSKGYSKAAAAGIVGNMKQESSLNVDEPGGGLIQGQGGRTSSGSLNQQLNGVLSELNGSYRGVANELKGAKTPEEAARIFSKDFEKPGTPELQNRESYAREAFGGRGLAGTSALPQSHSTGVGSMPAIAAKSEQVEVPNPKAKGLQMLEGLLRSEKGSSENPLLRSGVLSKAAEPTIKTVRTLEPSQSGQLGSSVVPASVSGATGIPSPPPNLTLPSKAPAPEVAAEAALRSRAPKLPPAVSQAKAALEKASHHSVSLPELEKEVNAGPKGHYATPVETPTGKVVKTPGGPVFFPHKLQEQRP